MPRGFDANCPRCGTKWPYDRKNKQVFFGECPAKCGYVGGPVTTPPILTRKRIFDAHSSNWARRHIYVIIAVVGLAVIVWGYSVKPYLDARDREIFESLSFDDPNWLYYKDLGDSYVVVFILFWPGISLILLSAFLAIGYWLIRRGVTLKMKESKVS